MKLEFIFFLKIKSVSYEIVHYRNIIYIIKRMKANTLVKLGCGSPSLMFLLFLFDFFKIYQIVRQYTHSYSGRFPFPYLTKVNSIYLFPKISCTMYV